MSSFLNKNKFKNKFFRVAVKALVFSFFCFAILSINFNDRGNLNFGISEVNAIGPSNVIGYFASKWAADNAAEVADVVLNPIDSLLLSVLMLMGILVKVAVFLFEIVVNPKLFDMLFRDNGKTIFEIWSFIRDFLNIFFILILLFSAFATVFQVSKYHIKNIILMVILMALLVNFSWPITRVIVDFSNVTMYFLIEEMIGDPNGTTAKVGALSKLSDIMVPEDFAKAAGEKDTTYLLLSIMVMFIFGLTLLAYAGVLLVRVIALVILLIFSPIGFVAAAFPSTSGYSKKWWDALFKYAFNGPILIFMLIVAIKILEVIGGSGIGGDGLNLKNLISQKGLENELNSIAKSIAVFVIPIMILWTALTTAGKAGDSVSAGISNKVKGWGDASGKWARKRAVRLPSYAGRTTDFTMGLAGKYAGDGKAGKFLRSRPFATSEGFARGKIQKGKDVWGKMEKERTRAVERAKAGAIGELAVAKQKDTEIREKTKKLKDDKTSMTSALKELEIANDRGNENDAQAVRTYIATMKDGITSSEDLKTAVEGFGSNHKDIEKLLNTATKDAYFDTSDTVYKDLRENFERMGNEGKNALKILNNKMLDTNGADKIVKGGGDIEMFKGIQADILAKQKKLFEEIRSGGSGGQHGADLNQIKTMLANKMQTAPSFEIKFKEKANSDILTIAENQGITGPNI